VKIATWLLRTWGQNDLPLHKGYKEEKKILLEFFGAMRVQSSSAKCFYF